MTRWGRVSCELAESRLGAVYCAKRRFVSLVRLLSATLGRARRFPGGVGFLLERSELGTDRIEAGAGLVVPFACSVGLTAAIGELG